MNLFEMLDCKPSSLGTIESVELRGTVVSIYTERHTADHKVLQRCSTYLRSMHDMLCWNGAPPCPLDEVSGAGNGAYKKHPVRIRHDFRVPDAYHKTAREIIAQREAP